ncbi:MAG: YfiR family protein [Candidatus Delongbacteria bacterium]|nr:YfiR family protein [Candidatus Delongbacteria bacterium]MBN2834729.1 YfiR family protein [Candidatus Delongbacteria bacterium]
MKYYLLSILFFFNLILSQSVDEYDLKAVYFNRISEFINWPDSIFVKKDGSRKFILAVYGEDPFEGRLRTIYNNYKILDMDVEIKYLDELDDINECHLLFVSSSEERNLKKIVKQVRGKPILTVSDTEGFGEKGIMLNILADSKGVHFVVNKTSEKNSAISISTRFMKYAKVVE